MKKKCLIVNADDFGLHPAVNRAIVEGFQRGCIRSASLMAVGAAGAEAAELAKSLPGLGVGVHLTLVAERPVLPPERIPSLVDRKGRLLPDYGAFLGRFLHGGIRRSELLAECEAQIARIERWGISPTHLDSHQHLHVFPGIRSICFALMKAHGIQRMRLPAEPFLFAGGAHAPLARRIAKCALTSCARMAGHEAKKRRIRMPDAFFGMTAGGHLDQRIFHRILEHLPDGISEIMIHPGADAKTLGSLYHWGYHWEEELAAAVSEETMQLIQRQGIELASFAIL